MASAPVRDPLSDHLLTPENAAFLLIDYQPSQLAGVGSMDRGLLLKNAVVGAVIGGALLRPGPLRPPGTPPPAHGRATAPADASRERAQ